MVQFYLLSVVFNIISALILIYGKNLAAGSVKSNKNLSEDILSDLDEKGEDDLTDCENDKESSFIPGLDNVTLRLVLGILTVFVALIKLLSAYKGIPVLGDFLPALVGFFAGSSMLIEYYLMNCMEPDSISESIKSIFIDARKYIGIAAFIISVLHFIMPSVIIF